MAKALKIGAIVVGVAALAIVTGGAAAGLGVSLATGIGATGITAGSLVLASTALSVGAALLQGTPKVPAAQTERLFANIDPRTFRKTVLGQTAFPIDVRYEEWSGKDQEYGDWIVCFASHAIDGLEEIWFNTELAWTAAGGVQGKFRGYFDLPNLVLEGSPANAFTFASGKWNGSARLTGCAYARFRFKMTGNGKKGESPFSGGIPSRITAIGRGAKLYDPRRDSTVPGGNGPMRADDQSTWRFKADDGAVIGENLPLQILRVVLGWRIRNPTTGEMRLATGSGVPGRRLALGSFIDAANLADELVNRSAGGQEPRYHGAAVVSEGDDPKTTLDMLCAACCARFRDTGGRLSLAIAHNDLAAVATDDGLTDDDVIGAFTWDPDPALEATPNIVRGRYVDATTASLYQLIDYPEVRIASPDGQDRVLPLDLGAIESSSQAQRVAKQVLQRRQYQREFTSTFDIRAWKYTVGDVLPFTFAPLSFARALFRVKAQELTQDGSCAMTLTVEHPSIYLWDASDAAPVQAAEPIVYDARNNPLILAINDAATTADWDKVTDPSGTKPADNATNGADPNSPFGPDRTVGETLAQLDAIEEIEFPTEAIDLLKQADADRAAAERQMQRALDLLGEAILRVTGEASFAREVMRDAGIVVDSATGKVRIYAVDLLAERTNAQLTLVDQTLDAVNGALTSKVERTEFDALATNAGFVEQVLSSAGGASGLSFTARQARAAGNDGAEAGLRALLAGDEASRRTIVQIAEVRQEVFAKIIDASTAEAVARQLLNVQIGTVDARLATEILTRIDEGKALARQITALGVTDGNLAADIANVQEALIEGDEASVRSAQALIASSEERTEAAIKRIDEAYVKADATNAQAIQQVTARLNDVGGVTIEEKFDATADRLDGVEGRYSVAIDANGNLIGFQLIGSTGGPGSFNLINTDLRMGTGRVIFNNGQFMRVQGTGFGRFRDLLTWYGPTMAVDDCTIGNALAGETTSGISKIGGLLVAGRFSNQTAGTGLGANEVAVLGPFGGAGGVVRASVSWLYGRTYEQSYPATPDGRNQFEQDATTFGAVSQGVEWFGTLTENVPASTITLTRTLGSGQTATLGTPLQLSTQTTTMRGYPPVVGDQPGHADFRVEMGGGFTVTDPVQAAVDRTLRLTLARGFSLGGSGIVQRLSIIAIEE